MDDLLPVIIYLVLASKVENIIAEMEILQEFMKFDS